MYLFYLFLFLSKSWSFTLTKIEPEEEFHDKTKSLIVKCNASVNREKPILIYSYKHINYTIPQIINNDPYVYIGNFTSDKDQYRVNIICIKNVTQEFLSSKIYLFGYSPSTVLIDEFYPVLSCQDYNFMRVICCLSPNENKIASLTGLMEEQNGHLTIDLLYTNTLIKEQKYNSSCFNLTKLLFTPSINLQLEIKNDLGNASYNFQFQRYDIMKPEQPGVILSPNNTNLLQLTLRLIDDGEFIFSTSCSSKIPLLVEKTLTQIVHWREVKIFLDGWWPNSEIVCKSQLQLTFGGPKGSLSEITISTIRMPEDRPRCGPFLSNSLMQYQSIDVNEYLENVVIYFTDLDLIDKNGIITNYQWQCNKCEYNYVNVSGKTHTLMYDIRSIRLTKAALNSLFSITACTKVGCSPSWNSISFIKLSDNYESYRIVVIRNRTSRANITLLWYMDKEKFRYNSSITQPKIVMCNKSKILSDIENECTSIKIMPLDNTDWKGRKSFQFNNLSEGKFALLSSLSSDVTEQIRWLDCIYEIPTIYEIEKKLTNIPLERFIKLKTNCSWTSCSSNLTITLPTCKEISYVVFTGIKISYESNNGIKHLIKDVLVNGVITFNPINLATGSKYKLNITIITSDNVSILWYTHYEHTGWWSVPRLIGVIFSVIIASILLIILFVIYIRKMKNEVFKKNYEKPTMNNNVVKNNSVKPISLLNNAECQPNFPRNDNYTPLDSSSPKLEPVYPTNDVYEDVDLPDNTKYTNIESTDSSNDSSELVLIDTNPLCSNYVQRPENTKFTGIYMNIIKQVPKETPIQDLHISKRANVEKC